MKKLVLLFISFSILLSSFRSFYRSSKTDHAKKWVSLFNGKNLEGWIPKIAGYPLGENFGNTFRVENGILSTRYNAYDSFRNRFGALYFNKKFVNFRLKVEYRFVGELTPGAPSWGYRDGGIQYYCQAPASLELNQPFPICLEYNLHGGNGREERPNAELCANGTYVLINGEKNSDFCTTPFVKKTLHGDQWVTAEIEVKDGIFRHFINGEEVLQFQDPRYDSANAIARKLIVKGNNKVSGGYISLQSNSHPMDFRKIEIMEY